MLKEKECRQSDLSLIPMLYQILAIPFATDSASAILTAIQPLPPPSGFTGLMEKPQPSRPSPLHAMGPPMSSAHPAAGAAPSYAPARCMSDPSTVEDGQWGGRKRSISEPIGWWEKAAKVRNVIQKTSENQRAFLKTI